MKNDKAVQLAFVLALFFLSEAVTTISHHFKADFHNYSALIKGGFILVALLYSLYSLKTFRKHILLFLTGMSLVFVVGQYTFNNLTFGEHFLDNTIYFGRYIFVFILVLIFVNKRKLETNKAVFSVYEKIVVFNSVLILLGVLFDIVLFKTYYYRFGYNGLFMAPSISTFFYALALTYFLNQYLVFKKKLPELILVCLVCFLTGTKALILFFCLSALHWIWIHKWYLKKKFYATLSGIGILIFVFRKSIYDFLYTSFRANFELYEQDGLITALTSFRNLKLKENFLPLMEEKWGIWNYLFGGTDFVKYRVEFEVFDVILFFGILGTLMYFFFYFKHIIRFNTFSSFGKVQVLILLFTALLSGTFFNNAPVALYLLVVLSSLQITHYKKEKYEV